MSDQSSSPRANWNYPTAIRFGPGRIKELADACRAAGITRPLLVTDAGLAKLPITTRALGLLKEAGLPDGVLNIVHGDREVVEAICDHADINAITFVGSTRVAAIVYRRGTSNLKRVLALGGAKNHLIVMPDADVEMTATNVVSSMSGCAGQRCMAASVMLSVGDTSRVIRSELPEQDLVPSEGAQAGPAAVRPPAG